jgi:uncharacterized protein
MVSDPIPDGRVAGAREPASEDWGPPAPRMHPSLPIHRLRMPDGRSVLYAPGHLLVVSPREADALQAAWTSGHADTDAPGAPFSSGLCAAAADAVRRWEARSVAPFSPECLTVHLSQRCNLRCAYCYAQPELADRHGGPPSVAPVVDLDVVEAAARMVVRYCAPRGKTFTLVLHGGGDPMVHPDLVSHIVTRTRSLADDHGLGWFGYLATNGVFSPDRARWLAAHLSLVGISCDGPPGIQDRQRPAADGRATAHAVERTARILAESGVTFAVRSTITPATMARQTDIVEYLHGRLGAREIRFEPVYGWTGGRAPEFVPGQAAEFVRHFLAAQRVARSRGCTLTSSGARLDQLHGPHCHVLRDVLQVAPGATASPCFVHETAPAGSPHRFAIASRVPATGEFRLDIDAIERMRRHAARIPSPCDDCVNAYHCARGCPEVCDLANGEGAGPLSRPSPAAGGFRCLVQRRLAIAWILEAAAVAGACSVRGATDHSAPS